MKGLPFNSFLYLSPACWLSHLFTFWCINIESVYEGPSFKWLVIACMKSMYFLHDGGNMAAALDQRLALFCTGYSSLCGHVCLYALTCGKQQHHSWSNERDLKPWTDFLDIERGLCVYRRRHGMRDEFISFTRSDEIMGQKEDGNWHGVLTTLKGQWSEVNRVRMKIITVMFKGIICKGVNLVLNKLAPEHFVLCYRFVL